MAQLHLYLSDELVERVKEKARSRGLTVSAYLAELVRSQISDDWSEDFFTSVVGGWEGEPLTRPEQPPLERREEFDVPSRHERVHPDPQ
jgi:hypothetical protein